MALDFHIGSEAGTFEISGDTTEDGIAIGRLVQRIDALGYKVEVEGDTAALYLQKQT